MENCREPDDLNDSSTPGAVEKNVFNLKLSLTEVDALVQASAPQSLNFTIEVV